MKVVNLKTDKYSHYIGRGSIFGNPFIIGKNGNRKEVINLYKHYARTNIELLKAIYSLPSEAVLGCFCHPKACHGDIIIELYNQYWKIK